MANVHRSALVPFSAEQMFLLVNDVAAYPEFLPGCQSSQVLSESKEGMMARVDVAKMGISKSFTTQNTLIWGREIGMNLVDGPFRSLHGHWRFEPIDDDACHVELSLEFEFTSPLIEMAFGQVFKELTHNMVKAFSQRAHHVYQSCSFASC
ncbi:Ribosome association toxin RatA [Vibrio stylophorae]|uniref:Ribosome association toxin RatA n=1 Tax=Vibrio stylophorae TaxID=659351 RepID=A0ABN8DQA0_9VIBR|nr:type II toxin-antitoxin system RatA family toxin [Vibrio stylophorae]CAH0532787.1 Ribosome association toxin RatA [Vibrio stylophorae]